MRNIILTHPILPWDQIETIAWFPSLRIHEYANRARGMIHPCERRYASTCGEREREIAMMSQPCSRVNKRSARERGRRELKIQIHQGMNSSKCLFSRIVRSLPSLNLCLQWCSATATHPQPASLSVECYSFLLLRRSCCYSVPALRRMLASAYLSARPVEPR